MRSIDSLQPREVPASWSWVGPHGEETFTLTRTTLLVAVKENCDGCESFLHGDHGAFADYDLRFVASEGAFPTARQTVFLAPAVLLQLGMKWPPTYVVIEPHPARIVAEGVVFSPEQVAEEISVR